MNGSDSNTAGKNVATVAFKKKAGNDCIGDDLAAEIMRRLEVTFENQQTSDIWSGAEAPTDLSLIWWPKDPITGARVGQPRTYDPSTSTWVPLGQVPSITRRERRNGSDVVAAATSFAKTITFDPKMPNANYQLGLTITTKVGSTFQVASANMDDFNWQMTAQTAESFTITFFKIPTGGLGFDWEVNAIADTNPE